MSDREDANVGDGHCDTDGDLTNGDQCTLRAAIQEINAAGSGSISFNVNLLLNNVITLNSALPDINSDLSITGPGADILTLQRNPTAGTPEFRILTIDAGKSVTISGLTVTGGKPSSDAPSIGGGILNLGSLTINASKITANSAEGIYNNDTLSVNNSTVLGNTGGGISSHPILRQGSVGGISNLTITNSLISGNGGLGGINCGGSLGSVSNCTINGSTISGNSSPFGWGGGISNGASDSNSSATMSIDRSTISGNDTTDTAGGVYNIAVGNASASITITNTTISGNSSNLAGGIYQTSRESGATAHVTITNGTISKNVSTGNLGVGGIFSESSYGSTSLVTLSNTIVAGNVINPGSHTSNISGSIDPASSFNLVGDGTGLSGISNGANGNQIGTSLAPIDPLLGPLTNNSGPTKTHALLAGSPAIDAGNSLLTIDQRSQARPVDDPNVINAPGSNAADIGAYEAHMFLVNSTADADDGACTPTGTGNGCTLREAINASNALNGGLVTFAPALTAGGPITITLDTALPNLSSDQTIAGPGAGLLKVQRSPAAGTPDFRIFTVIAGTTITLSGMNVNNGKSNSGGGGIANDGTLSLIDVTVSNNQTSNGVSNEPGGPGGGIYNNGELAIANSKIIDNLTGNGNGLMGGRGGGIYNQFPNTVKVINSTVSGNQTGNGSSGWSGGEGGGIFSQGPLEVAGSTISNNKTGGGSSAGTGGGIYATNTFTLTNSTVSGNQTSNSGNGDGGGILCGLATLANSTITNNSTGTSGKGGGISSSSSTNIKNTIIAGNKVGSGGLGPDIYGSLNSQDYNLIGLMSGGSLTGVTTHNINSSNPLLGSLANNGGPTMTHALLVGSPAINAGSNALAVDQNGNPLTTDQRGANFARIVNGTVDIGAFELQAGSNPIDDPTFFVKQQYLDFLNRQPDQSGWDFWTNQITSCGVNAQCIQVQRVNTSGAFFLSIEFQQTGNLVYKMYKAGFGNLAGKPVAVDRASFIADTRQIQSTPAQVIVGQGNWQAQLETNKQAFALAFVQRQTFESTYSNMSATDYVNKLFTNTGASPTVGEISAAVAAFNNAGGGDAGRAAALRSIAESSSVTAKLNNEAFVLMQYFGYLQRNPYDPPEPTLDYSGFNFWLGKLNQFNGDFIAAEMVKAFISSTEYRQRFGP